MNPEPDLVEYVEQKGGWIAYTLDRGTYYVATEPCKTEELARLAYSINRKKLQNIRTEIEHQEPYISPYTGYTLH